VRSLTDRAKAAAYVLDVANTFQPKLIESALGLLSNGVHDLGRSSS
jgi:hypothetical protein